MSAGTIIYIGGFELPDKNAAAHRVLSNAKIFRDLGYKVIFIDVDKDLYFNNDIFKTHKIIQGFECWSVPYPKTKSNWIHYLTDIDNFIKIYKKYDKVCAVICYNFQSIALGKIIRFSKSHNFKVIADCTEWYSARGNGFTFFIIKGIDTFLRMRVLHKKVDGLIVISRFLENYYRKSKYLIYLPPLVDLSENKWKKTTKINRSDIINLVYAGSPGKKDKINLLIDTLSIINVKFKLTIIGISKDQYLKIYPYHEDLIEKNEDRFCFIGRINHLQTLEYIKKANYSCFFRDDNRMTRAGFPTKFVESISCGIPVITNENSNINDYIDIGIIMVKDITSVSIRKLLNDALDLNIDNNYFDYHKFIKDMLDFIHLLGEKNDNRISSFKTK